jgi:sugar lactone lactonase YvrE
MMKIKVACNQVMKLGEGPLWHPQEQCLYWVDIVSARLYRLDPEKDEVTQFKMPSEIGCVAWRAQGGLVAALRDRFVFINTSSGQITNIAAPLTAQDGDVMFNDGKCDRQGRFWAGTKDQEETASIASIYCLDAQQAVQKKLSGFTVSNGIAWSLDNRTLYICDSPQGAIYQYDFDPLHGHIGDCRLFARVAAAEGYPDGLTVDREGYLWNCHWDGWRITRYKPSGEIDSVLSMPVPRPTSCCFGGPDLKTLYVTSASLGLSRAVLEDAPLSGQTFALSLENVQGIPEPAYQG